MKWFITGGSGFIGTNLIKRLLEDERNSVTNIDREAPRVSGAQWIEADISKISLNDMVNGYDIFIHLACQPGVEASVSDPVGTFFQNVYGTLNCLESARRMDIKRFVFASSGGTVLGKQSVSLREDLAPNPASPYGASKLACEGYCKAYNGSYELETVNLRFSNVYGPYSEHKDFNLIPAFIMGAIKNKLCYINGDGSITKDYIFVEDLIDAILKASHAPNIGGETFQIATGLEASIVDVYKIINALSIKYLGRPLRIEYRNERVGDVRYSCDITKAQHVLNLKPLYGLEKGLEETFKWYLENWGKEN
jgi:UDP-glucose 4-epimerase